METQPLSRMVSTAMAKVTNWSGGLGMRLL
jgi:hypothetical protein